MRQLLIHSDSGPDSGANDNCRWIIDSLLPFDTIVFSPADPRPNLGSKAAPTAPSLDLEAAHFPWPDSLLFLTDVDGVLDCGDTASATTADGTGTIDVFHDAQTGLDSEGAPVLLDCLLKPYTIDFVRDVLETASFFPIGDATSGGGTRRELC